ncbi:MAG: type II toxin-antitoxin system Phd/YefM family antitoxin [Ruthenibacterium sp.]
MPNIRPVSDLKNHFADIAKEAQATSEPVFLTKNGVGSFVIMSMDTYNSAHYESDVYDKLRQAEMDALSTDKRYSHKDVMCALKKRLLDNSAVQKDV